MTQIIEAKPMGGEDPATLEWAKALAEAPAELASRFFQAVGSVAVEQIAA